VTRSLALLLAFAVSSVAFAGVDSAEVEVTVDPEAGTVDATVRLVVTPEPEVREIELLLNRRLDLSALASDPPLTGFERERIGTGPYRYAPQALPIRLTLASRAGTEPVRLRLEYGGPVEPDAWGVTQLTERWVELELLYTGWIPFSPEAGPFDLRLRVHLPEGWTAVGTGRPTREEDVWVCAADGVRDVVLLASPELQRVDVGDSLTLSSVDLPPAVPERIAVDAQAVRTTLGRWFGVSGGSHLDLVFAPRESGGGFARPGLVVMLYEREFYDGDSPSEGFVRYLAHEISHLWWNFAPTTSWEDWLNESFAEVTALLLVRDRFGEEPYRRRLDSYRRSAAAAPPIRGIDRDDDAAYAALYRKGPVILAELEDRVGRDAFLAFLRELIDDRADSTDRCLATLERVVSKEERDRLDAALDR
jgi:hypothetical protein